MSKLIVTVGVSGSGKSTWAKEQWEKAPLNTIVVNRDKIRELLFGFSESSVASYYSRSDLSKLEKEVTLYEDTIINEGLCQGKTVIVDATHLKQEYLKRFEYWNVLVEYIYFDIDLSEAIQRDKNRLRSVGEDVIKRQYNQYKTTPRLDTFTPTIFNNIKSNPSVWIFDIDGTIAHMVERNAFDWNRVGEDILDEPVSNVFHALNRECEFVVPDDIIFCSGRDEVCRNDTLEWLRYHLGKFNNYDLRMRSKGDQRPDWIVKEEIWRDIAKTRYIEALIDDRNQVVRRARALGIKVFQVEYGNF